MAPRCIRRPGPGSTAGSRAPTPESAAALSPARRDVTTADQRATEEVLIEAGRGLRHYWLDLWRYRELFLFLAWRDLSVRYKQTAIGVAWSVLRPLLVMVVFTLVFGSLAGFGDDPAVGAAPYPIVVFAALLPWQFFASALSESSQSLVQNANMISKVYFPRLAMPVSSMIVNLADLAISFCLLVGLMILLQYPPSPRLLALPPLTLLAIATALGAGIWMAALNVKYRDFRYIVPFIVQLGLYVSPVGFPSSVVPDEWRLLYSINPLVGVIDGFRWAIIGPSAEIFWPGLLLSVLLTIVILALGILYFRHTERTFADVI
jgi:lipopolysaccharide transport system permease protein